MNYKIVEREEIKLKAKRYKAVEIDEKPQQEEPTTATA
jgi:hypothetical protein